MDETFYVHLCNEPTIFEPISSVNSVFFDNSNKEIFTLRSRGLMGVNVRNPFTHDLINFRIEDRGDVLSIKFSADHKILAMQRSHNSVDFLNVVDGVPVGSEYSQSCKKTNAKLLGIIWTQLSEILFVTSEQLELYQVNTTKKCARLLKNVMLPCNWFLWDVLSRTLAVSSGLTVNSVHFFNIKIPGIIRKVTKFELPLISILTEDKSEATPVPSSFCLLAPLYSHLYFFLVHKWENGQNEDVGTIKLYKIRSEHPVELSDVLLLPASGRLAINVVDNLVLIHNQTTMSTAIYDILVNTKRGADSKLAHHQPVLFERPISPLSLASKDVPSLSSNLGAQVPVDLYTPMWITNLPNFVIDGQLGCLWTLSVDAMKVSQLMKIRSDAFDFLLNRSDGKNVLLNFCSILAQDLSGQVARWTEQDLIADGGFCSDLLDCYLDDFTYLFKRLGVVYHKSRANIPKDHTDVIETSIQLNEAVPLPTAPSKGSMQNVLVPKFCHPYVVEQSEVLEHILLNVRHDENSEVRLFCYHLLIGYIRSLLEHDIPVELCFYEHLVSTIARLGIYDQLTYCVQHRFLADSKPIALQLLSLEPVYPPAGQLAVDMLKRLGCLDDELIEVLLLRKKPVEALKFCQTRPYLLHKNSEIMQKLIDQIKEQHDGQLVYYSTRKFLQLHTSSN